MTLNTKSDWFAPKFSDSVTPNDSTDLTNFGRIYVGTGGDVKVDTEGGDTVTYSNVISGSYLRPVVRRVYSTGTTASNINVEY